MKVMAKISDKVVLCEVSSSEIAKLMGADNDWDRNFDEKWMRVGVEIDLVGAYSTLKALRGFNAGDMKSVRSSLEAALSHYEKIIDLHEKVMLFDTLKKTGEEK